MYPFHLGINYSYDGQGALWGVYNGTDTDTNYSVDQINNWVSSLLTGILGSGSSGTSASDPDNTPATSDSPASSSDNSGNYSGNLGGGDSNVSPSTVSNADEHFTVIYGASTYIQPVSNGYNNIFSGAYLDIFFNDAGYNYQSYQWIQTVSQTPNAVKNGKTMPNPFIDESPFNPPFYYSTRELQKEDNSVSRLGYATALVDRPGMTYGSGSFSAESTLVGLNANGSWVALGSFYWGYTVFGLGVSVITPYIFSPTPSQTQQQIIQQFHLGGH